MNNNYQIFIRDDFQDTGTIPSNAEVACQSPDIIPVGVNLFPQPEKLIGPGWDTSPAKPLSFGYQNYIYVRGKSRNNIGRPVTATVNLYYSRASLLLNPASWVNNIIYPAGSNVLMTATANDQRLLGSEPFVWMPPGITGDHYCLIAQVVTPDMPNPIPADFSKTGSFAAWVLNNPAIAWRNIVVETNLTQPSSTYSFLLQNIDTAAENYSVIGACVNYPKGTAISFACPAAGVTPPINVSLTVPQSGGSFQLPALAKLAPSLMAEMIVTIVPPVVNGQPVAIPTNAKLKIAFNRAKSGNRFSDDAENDSLLQLHSKTAQQLGIDVPEIAPDQPLVQLGQITVVYQ